MRHNRRHNAGGQKYKRLPKNAHEQKRLLLWIAGLVDHVRMHGSEKDLDTLESIGVRLNAKEFYDTEKLTQAQYSSYTKLLSNLERRGFIERSPEQYVPHVKLTGIGQLEVIQIWHEDNVEALREAAGWPYVDLTSEARRFRAKVNASRRYLELDNAPDTFTDPLKTMLTWLDARIAEGEDFAEVIPWPPEPEEEGEQILWPPQEPWPEPSAASQLLTDQVFWELLTERQIEVFDAELTELLQKYLTTKG